mgnify:CR=1 FL=1
MRFVSFVKDAGGCPRFGALLDHNGVVDLSAPACGVERPAEYLDWFDMDTPCHQEARALVERVSSDPAARVELDGQGALLANEDVLLLAPVPRPGPYLSPCYHKVRIMRPGLPIVFHPHLENNWKTTKSFFLFSRGKLFY